MAKFGKVTAKRAMWGSSATQAGKRVRAGTQITNENGEVRTLLTPAGRGAKFAEELRQGKQLTNDGVVKKHLTGKRKGKEKQLTAEQRAFRAGYLESRKDSAKAFKAKKK